MYVGSRDQRNQDCRWNDEATAGNDQTRPASLLKTYENRQLGRAWPRNEIGRAQAVEEVLLGNPMPLANDLILHHGNVGGGATEGDGAKLKKNPRNFAKRN